MTHKIFNVLLMDWNNKKIVPYDILPYFRRVWEDKPFLYDDNFKKQPIKNKSDLKEWVEHNSRYQYWARCEYEFLVLPWPNHENDKAKKIDVHFQIMQNIDIVTDILYDEFKEDIKGE